MAQRLSAPEVEHFLAFGFVTVRQLFTPHETLLLRRGLDDALTEERGGGQFTGCSRETVHNWWVGQPLTEFIQTDPRVLERCEQLLGPGFTGSHNDHSNDDGNVYVGDTQWHADMGWDPKIPQGRTDPLRAAAAAGEAPDNAHLHMFPSLKVAFYLDPVTAATGALR